MPTNPDAELLAALDAVLGFIEQTIANNRTLAEALRDGRRPKRSPDERDPGTATGR